MKTKKEKKRLIWKATRNTLESLHFKFKPKGSKSQIYWKIFKKAIAIFYFLLKVTNLHKIGMANAKNIKINNTGLKFSNLPEEFDGYKILFISDFHFNTIKNIEDYIIKTVKDIDYDLVLFGGDFRGEISGNYKHILNACENLIKSLKPKDGIFSVLGNHDSYRMVDPVETMGATFLINESIKIKRGNSEIAITGTDDVFYYYTEMASDCLLTDRDVFKIVLVHSPDLIENTSKMDYDLYLCGHTHGGQICLPGGRHIISHTYHHSKMVKGVWKYGKTTGFTTKGCGCSGIPIRFNCDPEVVLLTLSRANNYTFC